MIVFPTCPQIAKRESFALVFAIRWKLENGILNMGQFAANNPSESNEIHQNLENVYYAHACMCLKAWLH